MVLSRLAVAVCVSAGLGCAHGQPRASAPGAIPPPAGESAASLSVPAGGSGTAAQPAPAGSAPTLYKRLGGYDAVAAVVDDFLGRLLADRQLARFFAGHGVEAKKRIRQFLVDQICAETGGPCVYVGRDMQTVHTGLGISEADWQATVAHLVATLDAFRVPAAEKGELLAAISSLKEEIVEDPERVRALQED